MKVTGETMIFRNDKGYSTTISNRTEDGSYENMFISVNFKKGIEIENKTKINITDGFLSFYKTKDGLPKIKLVVMDFESDNYEQEEREAIQNESNYNLNDDDLPF